MKKNIVKEKSYEFALKIVRLSQQLNDSRQYVLGKQLLKSGTSIGANVEEALGAQSKRDFQHKISISYKEARETKYWLRLMRDSKVIDKKLSLSLLKDCEELLKIIGSILKTLKNPNS